MDGLDHLLKLVGEDIDLLLDLDPPWMVVENVLKAVATADPSPRSEADQVSALKALSGKSSTAMTLSHALIMFRP